METYTNEKAEKIIDKAIKHFEDFTKNFENEYLNFLKNLVSQDLKPNLKYKNAYDKKTHYLNEMFWFVRKHYPQKETVVLNSPAIYTVDTLIHFRLKLKAFETDKKLDILYNRFLSDSFDSNL